MSKKSSARKKKLIVFFDKFNQIFFLLLNFVFVLVVFTFVRFFDSISVALVTLIISKWRIFAVKPRFWWDNIKSGLIDLSVGAGFIFLLSILQDSLISQLILSGLYLGWLIYVKPKESIRWIIAQGLTAVFVATAVMVIYSQFISFAVFVILEFIVGFIVSYHFLSNYNINHETKRLMMGFWGLTFMELGWIFWHWLIGYTGGFLQIIKIPQLAIIQTLLTYLFFVILDFAYRDEQKQQDFKKILPPVVFVVGLILVLVIFFSKPII